MDAEQVESIARELERLNDLYERLMEMCPLEFSLDPSKTPEMQKRKYISLMKELTYQFENMPA